ncbi:GNAT family N-acetyltransferase [Moritella viscosa]|uniref:GNAT family N-acetyltransferase n=1 Tax=Moritella viscosa TaxID=80854 RepID=UPI00091E8DF1|nr:GNAT family N-acetyltransferase [Moritella viscosa]SHO12153.1 Acetyltransferase, GNAT family [Moritella viscosa]SHO18309.1 Acetyltransferase, GNAT family [Moritella viscosa]
MIIRKANLDDVNEISQLIALLVVKYILPTCSKEGGLLILNSVAPNCISNYLDAGYVYHVAELNGELIGVVGMKENTHLYHLFVADSQQGKGLSRTLWELARDVCLANANEGKFTVNSALNAADVYLKFGFVPVSGVRERAGIKDMPMELTLYY